MGLDFQYTCPDVDKCINDCEDVIREHLEEIVREYNPILGNLAYLPDEVLQEIQSHAGALHDEITDQFEILRGINEDMRKQADHQIDELTSQIADLEYEIKELENG